MTHSHDSSHEPGSTRRVGGLLLLLAVSACATTGNPGAEPSATPETTATGEDIEPHVVDYPAPEDPLEPVNRVMFGFNDLTYRYVLVPVSRAYVGWVPEPARKSVGNWFSNLKMPINLGNHVAQLEWGNAGRDLGRFAINTTVGILGFRDPATERFDIEADPTGFADTLSHYGAGHGVYLTLPFVGPSDVTSGIGIIADWMVNPIRFGTENPTTFGVRSVDFMQDNVQQLDSYPELREESEDPYTFFRDLHLEQFSRDADYQ